jgi:hypothetical protein
MGTTLTVPVTITPEAAARVSQIGINAELERMLEYTCQTVTGLRRLDVVLEQPHDTGDEPFLTIEATRDVSFRTTNDATREQWGAWKVQTFPPEVGRHISLLIFYGETNAG